MKKLFPAFLFIVLLSCKPNSPKSLSNSPEIDIVQTTQFRDSLLSISDSLMNTLGIKDKCAISHRQILSVKSYVVVSGSYKPDSASAPEVGRYILLTGKHSPSSCELLDKAYLHFVNEKKQLRTPSFSVRMTNGKPTSAEIRLFYLESQFEAIQYQLSIAKDIYCWRGVFGNGHIWGDIHTSRAPAP
jgi:hypothetical protein